MCKRKRASGYCVIGYYSKNVEPPKKPNELALEVWCGSETLKDLEVKVFESRDDIGDIIVTNLSENW